MLVSYWKEMDKYIKWQKLVILLVLILFQVGLFCALKFYFFSFYNSNVTSPSTTNFELDNNSTFISNSTFSDSEISVEESFNSNSTNLLF